MESTNGLLFITVANPDEVKNKDTQRAIRRRVMRDIGRSRRKPKSQPAVTFIGQPHQIDHNQKDFLCPALESSPLPIDLDNRARQLAHFMQSEADYRYRPFRGIWFEMALRDGSAFKLSMANAAMFLDEAHHPTTFKYERSAEALAYYGESVRQVTRRLADPIDRASEGLMTAVLGLICHDLYVGTLDRWAYHIQGLKHIIQLRNGFCGLNGNLQLFASWFDVVGSVVKDTPPLLVEDSCFPATDLRPVPKTPSFCKILEYLHTQVTMSSELCLALEQVALVCNFVNSHALRSGFWRQEKDLSPLTMLGSPTHLLLSLPRFLSYDTNSFPFLHEVVRLALLILLAGLKNAYGLAAPEMIFLQDKLLHLIKESSIQGYGHHYILPGLQSWAIATACLLQPPECQRNTSVYTGEISRRMPANGFQNGDAVLDNAREILWIERLADPSSIEDMIFEIDRSHILRDD